MHLKISLNNLGKMAYQETVERIKSQKNYNICGFQFVR